MTRETVGPWRYESDGDPWRRTHYAVRRNDNAPCGTERKDFPSRALALRFINNANEVCLRAGLGAEEALAAITKARKP